MQIWQPARAPKVASFGRGIDPVLQISQIASIVMCDNRPAGVRFRLSAKPVQHHRLQGASRLTLRESCCYSNDPKLPLSRSTMILHTTGGDSIATPQDRKSTRLNSSHG